MNQDVQRIAAGKGALYRWVFWGGLVEVLFGYRKCHKNQNPVLSTEFTGGITYVMIPDKLKLMFY
jgi:hypothetical protein